MKKSGKSRAYTVKDYKKMVDTLYKELERKNKIIDELKERNQILIETSLKAYKKAKEIEEQARKDLQ